MRLRINLPPMPCLEWPVQYSTEQWEGQPQQTDSATHWWAAGVNWKYILIMAAVATTSRGSRFHEKKTTQQKLQYVCTEIFFVKFAVILMILIVSV